MSDSETKLRSRSGSQKPDYKIDTEGLEIRDDDDNDVDYHEHDAEHDGEDGSGRKKRSREDDDEDEDVSLEDDDEDEDEDDEDDGGKSEAREGPHKRARAKRARSATPMGGAGSTRKSEISYPIDEEGHLLPVYKYEYETLEDPEGEKKITADGDLLDGREFTIRSFAIAENNAQKFMLSTEVARTMGYRDSYMFFQYHPSVYKFVLGQNQKNHLIDQNIIPYSYRSRKITIVAAKSIYKEFGAKVIKSGKSPHDDYYVTVFPVRGQKPKPTASDLKRQEKQKSATATPTELPKKQSPLLSNPTFLEYRNSVANTFTGNSKLNSTNWLYQHAAACSRFNSDLYYDRVRVLLIEQQGLRDPYTNTLHIPQNVQSTKVLDWYKEVDEEQEPNEDAITCETIIKSSNIARPKTNLCDVAPEIYEGVVDVETKKAILAQQEYERQLY